MDASWSGTLEVDDGPVNTPRPTFYAPLTLVFPAQRRAVAHSGTHNASLVKSLAVALSPKSFWSRLADPQLDREESGARQWLRVALTVLTCTALCWVVEPYLQGTNLVLVYMSGVVYVALRSTRAAAWIAIALSLAVFDFVYVAPRWGFTPIDPNFYFTFVVMALVGGLVTELARGVRQHAAAVARAALEADAERMRATLLQGLSHDFRTPLTTIVGAASILLEQDRALGAPRRRELLDSILGEARRLHHLTDSLLDLTRMQEGAMKPHCEWCPAEEMVQEVVRAMETRLAGREVRVLVGPGAVVWCDPRLVEQALVNLIDNAIKHAPAAGAIDVTLVIGAHDWSLAVSDQGPGLPAGRDGGVFEKFQRGPSAPREGVGLGLALCAAIARLHGGGMVARNTPGASIVITLPQPPLQSEELDP